MNKIKFLSVSALNMFLSQPNKFYCTRLAENKLPRDPQSLAAAAGTMFDINVKKYLISSGRLNNYTDKLVAESVIRDRFIQMPWYQKEKEDKSINELFNDSLEPQNRVDEIYAVGGRLFDAYIKSKLFKETSFHDIENRNIFELIVKLRGVEHVVPIYTILDCVLSYPTLVQGIDVTDRGLYPMDLKVSGYSSGASPKPKYVNSYDESGNSLGAHKDSYVGMSFDLIDEAWATQGCAYGWSIGCKLFEPFPFNIHAVYMGTHKQDGSRSIKVCEYRGIITSEFQKITALKFITAWNTINGTGDTVVPWCDEPLLSEMLSRTEHFGW